MQAVIYAMEPGEPRVIRGKVVQAVATLYINGKPYRSAAIEKYPFQTNRIDLWFKEALRLLANEELRTAIRLASGQYDWKVNDGRGRLEGKEANQNKFSYRFLTPVGTDNYKIEVAITTMNYAMITAEKIKRGEHVRQPRKRAEAPTTPYICSKTGHIIEPDPIIKGFQITHDDHEAFYTQYPDLRGELPTY